MANYTNTNTSLYPPPKKLKKWTQPWSNPPKVKKIFISNILVKNVSKQVVSVLESNNIFDSFQSGFMKHHSTPYLWRLLIVTNNLLIAAN